MSSSTKLTAALIDVAMGRALPILSFAAENG
jgi:hypothetical protein